MSETIAVIGGGPAGLEAARGVAELGGSVVLIEKENFLGGTPIRENYAALTPNLEPAEVAMGRSIDAVREQAGVEILLEHQVTACKGEAPEFSLTVNGPGGQRTLECGGIIVATGFEHFDPGRETQLYGYYEHPDVLALQDLEAMLKEHNVVRPSTGLPPERICFVQCVGSRDRHIGNEYCSKVCCGVASKEAIEVRQLLPNCQVFIFYIDMRMYGYWENQIYWPAQEQHHVQCVGSRDRQIGNEYCSKVCCGVASKEAIEVRQLLPDCKVFIFYIDMRMYGYWENQIYWPAQEEHHVQYVKGIITEVLKKGDKLLVRGEDTTMGRPMEVTMDMVILSVGMEPSPGTRAMSRILGIEPNKYGFIEVLNPPLDTVSTSKRGIWACGASLGPADLEDCASSGAAAAMKALAFVRRKTVAVG